MAAVDSSDTRSNEELQCIHKNHDEAYLYISQGLSYQKDKKYDLARDMYNKGIEKINTALNVRCDRSYCVGPKWDKAMKMEQKMRKTLQMIKGQLENMSAPKGLSKDILPPSYEEACENSLNSAEHSSLSPAATLKPHSLYPILPRPDTLPEVGARSQSNGAVVTGIAEAQEIFSISDGVQLFFILSNNSVNVNSSSTSLHVYKLADNIQREQNEKLPSGWLQVGNWSYPLIPGHSPVLESTYGAFLFPDINNEQDGAAVAVILPAIDLATRQTFKSILDDLTALQHEVQLNSSQESFADTLSRGIVTGAEYVSAGLIKGALATGECIHKGASMLREHLQPESRPVEVDPRLQKGLEATKNISSVALSVSGYLVTKLADLTMALGKKLAPHIREQGSRFLTSAFDKKPDEAKDTMDNVMKIAAGGFQGFSTVYFGLQDSAKLLAHSLSTETVNTIDYKYGHSAGEAVNNAIYALGNLALTTHNFHALGVKSVAKKTAKDAGKAVLLDYIEKSDEAKEEKPK